jgi:hypothetical protein
MAAGNAGVCHYLSHAEFFNLRRRAPPRRARKLPNPTQVKFSSALLAKVPGRGIRNPWGGGKPQSSSMDIITLQVCLATGHAAEDEEIAPEFGH